MKTLIRNTVPSLFLVIAAVAYGTVPPLTVTVSDASGKAAYKGTTDTKGNFATANLKPGNYVVQFNANSAAIKGNDYTVVVSAGTKKVAANTVPGEKFTRGGVAMKVEVGAGLNISGQVAIHTGPTTKGGKKMVWIPPQLGSNFPGHWVEEGSAEAMQAKTAGTLNAAETQRLQERH